MNRCAWINCPDPARRRGVCERHYHRTIRAGRRARFGVRPADVRRTVARYTQQPPGPRTPVADRLDDLEWLLNLGEWPTRAAARCGWEREYAITVARGNNRPELAERLHLRGAET